MATTSLWRVKGRIDDVIIYIENPDKTSGEIKISIPEISDALDDVISYASREDATLQHRFVAGVNCDPATARAEMTETKKRFGKTGGTIAYHGYQSFAEGEVTPEMAQLIGLELATELWGDRYEVLIATHVDKESHIHNHFVINTVSFVDGVKFHRTKEDYRKMQEVSDRLCREHGLSVIKHPEGKGKNYAEWAAEQNGKPTYRKMIRRDIDDAVKASLTEKEFYAYLIQKGYELKLYTPKGKLLVRPSLRPPGAERYFRFDRLGADYDLDEIRYRLAEKMTRSVPFPEEDREKIRKYRNEYPPHPKAKGIAALYYHYCYELHLIARYPASVKRVSFFMRQDIRNLERLDEQVRFLGENRIETSEDVAAYREKAEKALSELLKERTRLRTGLKKCIYF